MAINTQTPRHKLTIIEDELILELASVIVADGGGTGVPGEGDMLSSTYDPQGIEGDAFDMANMTEGADAKVMTAAERASIAALGTALGLKADTASLSTVATTGAYADLTGTPALVVNFADLGDAATVDLPTINGPLGTALDGKAPLSHTHTVSQITDFPTLATVATSGAYADLTGTPSLVVNFGDLGDAVTVDLPTLNGPLATALGLKADASSLATVATSGSYSDLAGTPTLATVATSGDYGDLLNQPSLVVNFGDLGDATTVDLPTVNSPLSTALGLKADTSSLSTVATTGAYSDLSGTPTLATVATSGSYSDLTGTPTIPSDNQVSEYLVDDGIHSITTTAGMAAADAANGRSQQMTITENVTLATPTNLGDGESMSISGTQDATSRTFSLSAGYTVMTGGAAVDVTNLPALGAFELAIKRVGADYRIWISTEA